jgi:hypothetical protein
MIVIFLLYISSLGAMAAGWGGLGNNKAKHR